MWGRIWVGVFVACWIACWASGSTAAPGARAAPSAASAAALRALDKPAFTATPAELLAAGKTAPTGDWRMVILREQRDVIFDDVGRATVRARRVYVVQSENDSDPDDAEDDMIGAEWHPSYQNPPTIRARVITATGTAAGNAVELDPSQVAEKPLGPRMGTAESDRRYLGAALPALASGAVVEQEIVTSDREPPPAGSVDTTEIGSFAPTSSTVISYSAPPAAKIHHVERKLPAGARVRHQVAQGRETWRYEIGALPVKDFREVDSPVDVIDSPYVGVGTAASWEAVARAYRKLLDRRIADGPFALPAELPSTASFEAVAAITAWVHKRVRPAGALRDAVRTPLTPAETVKQAVGDGSDKATLLVALLRQAGIRADVALVAAGWDQVVDPELPGLGAFDRAIVRARVGARELWIDPGEPMARPGQLPERAQGRRALVIADDAKALTLTPAVAPADNTIREVRTFVAPEYGLSQLTQVVQYTGVLELEQRRWSRAARADALKKQYSHRVESMFGGTLAQIATSDAEDLTKPFEQTVTVKDVGRVASEREQIDVYLYPSHALEHLPWTLLEKSDRPRHNDFVWPVPQIHEVENRIAVPVGFDLPATAPERIHRLGTATLTERQRLDGRTLIVTFQLDTGKVRIAPAELATLHAAVQELEEAVVHIKIDQTAFALAAAGKPREAIAECERQIGLHPKEALHHDQLSTILLRAGIGEAARREARKAVAIAPGDVDALVVLGWTLGFDTLGRPYTYDWDRAGAIAALQQARKLDPKHLGAIEALAQVLERDAAGRVFESADLPAAIEAWRAALAIDKTDEHALALAKVLVWSGQFAEAEKVARTASAGEERNKWIVIAVAGSAGGKAAIKAADDLRSGPSRNQLLTGAGWALLLMQRYDAARELLTESGMMAKMPRVASAMLNKLKKHPALPSNPADPRFAVFDVLAVLLDPQHKTSAFWDAELERDFRGLFSRFIPAAVRALGATSWFGDIFQSVANVQVEGDAGVWRASLETDGTRYQMYFALDRNIAKLLGVTDVVGGVGRYIMRGGGAKADARARKLLDWIRADGDKSTTPVMATFKRLWGPGMPSSHDAIMVAAAVLAWGSDPDRTIPIASHCSSTLPDAELACHEVLFFAFRARGRWSDAVAQCEAIVALRPDLTGARAQIHAWALSRAGRFDEADRLLDGVLAKDPDHHGARIGRFEVAAMRGNAVEVLQRGDAVVNHPAATAWDLNYVAWSRLGLGGDLGAALELARKAVERAPRQSGSVNTLAALEAELGDLGRAIEDNGKAMQLRNLGVPTDDDWYVLGRIAEQLGRTEDAAAAYKRVARLRDDQLMSTYTLAQRRLAAMHVGH